MDANVIKWLIQDSVSVDIYGDLHGHDRVAEEIANYIKRLEDRIKQLESNKPVEPWEDRMGGQFTQEELLEAERNRW